MAGATAGDREAGAGHCHRVDEADTRQHWSALVRYVVLFVVVWLLIALGASFLRYTYGPSSAERARMNECREGPDGNAATGECG